MESTYKAKMTSISQEHESPLAIIIPYKIRKKFKIKSGTVFEVTFDKKSRLIYKMVTLNE